MRATIKDIAEYVGVSKSLVSIYLNRHPLSARIAEKTKKKIDDAVQKFNYKASTAARALSNGKTKTIGLVTGDISSVYSGFSAEMMLREAAKHGYQLLIALSTFDQNEEEAALENLLNRQADGIIYMMDLSPKTKLHRMLEGYPILQGGSSLPEYNSYLPDIQSAYPDILNCFYRNGCRKAAIIGAWKGFASGKMGYAYWKQQGMDFYICKFTETEKLRREMQENGCDCIYSVSSIPVQKFLADCIRYKIHDIPKCIYSYAMPYNYIDHEAILGIWHTSHKKLIRGKVERMIEMIEQPSDKILHIHTPVEFLDRNGMKTLFETQIADPYFSKIAKERFNLYNLTEGNGI